MKVLRTASSGTTTRHSHAPRVLGRGWRRIAFNTRREVLERGMSR
jgi:hypothetical protein